MVPVNIRHFLQVDLVRPVQFLRDDIRLPFKLLQVFGRRLDTSTIIIRL